MVLDISELKMPAAVEWDDVKKLDPATLHERYKDELDSFIDLLTSVTICRLASVSREFAILHVFAIISRWMLLRADFTGQHRYYLLADYWQRNLLNGQHHLHIIFSTEKNFFF